MDAKNYLLRAQRMRLGADVTARAMTFAGFKVHNFGTYYKCGRFEFKQGDRGVEFSERNIK